MSAGRSGYDDGGDYDNINWINWRGAVLSAVRGRRGQAFLRELLAALDAMPIKRLIKHKLEEQDKGRMSISHWGMHECECVGYCALGVVGKARGMDLSHIDVNDYGNIGSHFGIADAMAREIEHINDGGYRRTPEERFNSVRKWVIAHLKGEGEDTAVPTP